MQGPPHGGSVVTKEPCCLNVVVVGSRCSSRPKPAPAPASSAESLEEESRLGRHKARQFLQAVQINNTTSQKKLPSSPLHPVL